MESAPETPPLAFTSSSACPSPQLGSPPPATVAQTRKSKQDMVPDPTRPPLATSLTSLACLLSWGAGGERDPEGQDQDGDETELRAACEAAEAEPGASGRALVGRIGRRNQRESRLSWTAVEANWPREQMRPSSGRRPECPWKGPWTRVSPRTVKILYRLRDEEVICHDSTRTGDLAGSWRYGHGRRR